MTPEEAFDAYASGRGVSQEQDAKNWAAYEAALDTATAPQVPQEEAVPTEDAQPDIPEEETAL